MRFRDELKIQIGSADGRSEQSDIELGLGPGVARRTLRVVSYQQSRLRIQLSGRSQKDEVFYVIVEVIPFSPQSSCRVAKGYVNGFALLAFQVGIADLEGCVAPVRAEVVKLFERGSTI